MLFYRLQSKYALFLKNREKLKLRGTARPNRIEEALDELGLSNIMQKAVNKNHPRLLMPIAARKSYELTTISCGRTQFLFEFES